MPDDVLQLVLECLGAADAFDSVAGVSRRLRGLVLGHGTWQSLALTWPYLRKHVAHLRHEDEKKWPVVDPKRILKAWAARVERGIVKAREFCLDTIIWEPAAESDRDTDSMDDMDSDDDSEFDQTYGVEMDLMGTPDARAKFWGRSVPFLRFLRRMGPELQSISIEHGGVRMCIISSLVN
eukprot:tig00000339_g24183.t1